MGAKILKIKILYEYKAKKYPQFEDIFLLNYYKIMNICKNLTLF